MKSGRAGAHRKPKIGVLGIGMVGKEVARYFQENGWEKAKNLFLFDVDPKKNLKDPVEKAEIIFLCLPTPRAKDGSCDASFIEKALKKYDSPRKIFVIKSTVEPGTAERLQKKTKAALLFNPEFLTESRAWEDYVRPDRQIVGFTEKSLGLASFILNLLPPAYFSSPGVLGTYDFVRLNATEAELSKYASNVFGALKVSYANIIYDFASALTTDYENIRKAVAHDRRIGDAWMDVLHGGYRGFSGSCFPKDLDAFVKLGEKLAAKSKNRKVLLAGVNLFKAVRDYNKILLASQKTKK